MANIKRANTSGITKTGSAVPDVVDAPTIGTATVATGQSYTGSASVSVPFTPATTGGTASSYLVTSSSGNTNTGASSPISVSDTVGTARTYSVQGVNSSGTWIASSASNSVTPASVPQAPTMGSPSVATGQSYTGSANVSVSFTAGATGGASITGYTVTSSSGNTGTGASSPITVSDVVGTARTYTVTATNSQGTSSASSASAATTPSSVPQAPTIGTATAGDANASITFTANATGGSAITGYTATSSPGSLTGTSASSPVTVTGLTNGTAYTFTVTATNANGTSAASSSSNSVTPIKPTSFESIATVSGSGVSNVTFSSIPQTYTHLQIRAIAKSSASYVNTLRFNSDSSTNYNGHMIYGNGSTADATGFVNSTTLNTYMLNGVGFFGATVIDVLDYTSTTKTKLTKTIAGADCNGAPQQTRLGAGVWRSTAAISSITIYNDGGVTWSSGTTFALYGIKA